MIYRILLFSLIISTVNTSALAYQDGWTATNIMDMTDSCVASIIDPVRQGLSKKMQSQGKDPSGVSEDMFKPSLTDLCACITFRAAGTYEYEKVIADPRLTQGFMTEAIRGGECKPAGLLGKIIQQQ